MKSFISLASVIVALFLILSVSLNAQEGLSETRSTAEEIETLLNTDAVTYAQASRFILEAANVSAEKNKQEAFNLAIENNWLPKNVSPDDSARLDHISKFLLESFKVKGGIMYSITGNSHYAYRELVHQNVIQNRSDPAMIVSGERLLFYVSRILGRNGEPE